MYSSLPLNLGETSLAVPPNFLVRHAHLNRMSRVLAPSLAVIISIKNVIMNSKSSDKFVINFLKKRSLIVGCLPWTDG